MRASPQMARRALTLAGDLEESGYRRIDEYHALLVDLQGSYPASTIHGGSRRGGGISDPTGEAAINPHSDPARIDLHQAYASLHHAAVIFGQLDEIVTGAVDPLRMGVAASMPPPIRTAIDAKHALDTIGGAVQRLTEMWPAWHAAAVNGNPLDLGEAYNDLEHAVNQLGHFDTLICNRLGGDPRRIHCANGLGCPDRNPPAPGRSRCWACDKWFRRTRDRRLGPDGNGEERTRAAERAADGLSGFALEQTEPEPLQASTEPHSAPADEMLSEPGFGFGAFLRVAEGAA